MQHYIPKYIPESHIHNPQKLRVLARILQNHTVASISFKINVIGISHLKNFQNLINQPTEKSLA